MFEKQPPQKHCTKSDAKFEFPDVRSSQINDCADNNEEQHQRKDSAFKFIECPGNNGGQSHGESPFEKTRDSTLTAFLDLARSRLVAFALGVALGGFTTIQAVTEAFQSLDTASISLCSTVPAAPAN